MMGETINAYEHISYSRWKRPKRKINTYTVGQNMETIIILELNLILLKGKQYVITT